MSEKRAYAVVAQGGGPEREIIERVAGIPGLSLPITADVEAHELATEAGTLDWVLPLPGDDDFYLSEVSFVQFLSENFRIALGELTTLEGDLNDFAHGNGKTQFLNQNFVFNPVTLWTVPYSALGASVMYLPAEGSVLTVSVIDREGQPDESGFDIIDEGATAVAAEFRTRVELLGQAGLQSLGATWSDQENVSLSQGARPFVPGEGLLLEKENDSWSVYYNFDHYLTGTPEEGGWGSSAGWVYPTAIRIPSSGFLAPASESRAS